MVQRLEDKGLLAGEQLDRRGFHRASRYPSYFNQICEKIFTMGFRKMLVEPKLTLAHVNFSEPTIIFMPQIEGVPAQMGEILRTRLVEHFGASRYRSSINTSFLREFAANNRLVRVLTQDAIPLKIANTAFAHWYPRRNCLLVYFNVFNTSLRIRFAQVVLEVIHQEMQRNNVVLRLSPEAQSRREEELKLQKIKEFQKHIDDKIKTITTSIDQKTKDAESYTKSIIDAYRQIAIYEKKHASLASMKSAFEEDFMKKVEEIKKLPFVKNVELTSEGIEIYVGKLSMNAQDNGRNYHVYLGDYTIVIKPNGVTVKNPHFIESSGSAYQHPHVLSGNCCLGSASGDVAKTLGSFRLKELAFLMYQFLNTYTHGQGGNPYITIDKWQRARTLEKRFNPDGSAYVEQRRIQAPRAVTNTLQTAGTQSTPDPNFFVDSLGRRRPRRIARRRPQQSYREINTAGAGGGLV